MIPDDHFLKSLIVDAGPDQADTRRRSPFDTVWLLRFFAVGGSLLKNNHGDQASLVHERAIGDSYLNVRWTPAEWTRLRACSQ